MYTENVVTTSIHLLATLENHIQGWLLCLRKWQRFFVRLNYDDSER
jgi:hypothetical protein